MFKIGLIRRMRDELLARETFYSLKEAYVNIEMWWQRYPYHLKEGAAHWPAQREAFADTVVATLSEYCPTLPDAILHRHVLTPWDLEQEYGLTEGNIFHGELGLDQMLFLRPVPGWARYRTPLPGLWMCASGTHPGGGVMGAPGELAAKTLLQAGDV